MSSNRRMQCNRRAAGLTLIEIMVVVTIMGMIAALVTKVVIDRLDKAKVEFTKTQIAEIVGALQMFNADNGFYPSMDQGLAALVSKPTSGREPLKYAPKGYMPSIPNDPWGNPFIYIIPSSRGDFEVKSLGRDGVEGGEGYDADISSADLSGEKKAP